jgi:hypothetical protein
VGVDGAWGNEMDIMILRNALQKQIFVISDEETHLQELILSAISPPDEVPIFVTHEYGSHFNSVFKKKDNNNDKSGNNNNSNNINNNNDNNDNSSNNNNNNSNNNDGNISNRKRNNKNTSNKKKNNNDSNTNSSSNISDKKDHNNSHNMHDNNTNNNNNINNNNDNNKNKPQFCQQSKQKRKRNVTDKLLEWRNNEEIMTQFDTPSKKKIRYVQDEDEWIPNQTDIMEELLDDTRLELNLNL